jgi:DNA-nicking Smr family endonuclease
MSKVLGSGGAGRPIDPDEANLWQHTTRTLDRVKAKPRVVPSTEMPPEKRVPAPAKVKLASAERPKPKPARTAPAGVAGKTMPAAPPLADVDRRKARQVASGKIGIDARLDLHGASQRDARSRLRGFLFDAHARGCKTVLVITGKGGNGEPDRLGALMGEKQRGVLRRNVPLWLAELDLRAVVLGYTEAATRHGGAGALYVQLRKAARD